MQKLNAASVQFQHMPGDKQANLEKVLSFVRLANQQSVQVICFPECCISGYWHLRNLDREQLVALAEPIPAGNTAQTVMTWAKEYGMSIGVGLVEIDEEGVLYNSFVVAMPNGEFASHRKIHCFVNQHMASGDRFTVFDLPTGQKAGILICYDNNLIENARACALAGAEMIFAPHQTGGCDSGSPFAMGVVDRKVWDARHENPSAIEAEIKGDKGRGWIRRWLPARAHDNGLFYLFSNGVGPDDNEVRTGNAMILDPYGRTLAETWKAGDDMVVAELDFGLRERCTGVRWIRARRPELYDSLIQSTGNEQDTRRVRFDHLLDADD